MRRLFCSLLVVSVLLGFSFVVRAADEQAEGVKLAEAAIKDAGGQVKLDHLKEVSLKGKGNSRDSARLPGERLPRLPCIFEGVLKQPHGVGGQRGKTVLTGWLSDTIRGLF